MTVYFYTLKRLFKNKIQLLLTFLMPFFVVFPVLTMSGVHTLNLGVVDNDKTFVTKGLKNYLSNNFNIITIKNSSDIKQDLNKAKASYAIELDSGFTEKLLNGSQQNIKGYGNKKYNVVKLISSSVDSYINPVKMIAKASNGNHSIFENEFNKYNNNLRIKYCKINKPDFDNQKVIWGLVIMLVMFSSVYCSSIMVEDKENKTFYRTISTSISKADYMIQNVLCFFTISAAQVILISCVLSLVFNVYAGKSLWYMMTVLVIFSIVSTSIGVATSSFFNTTMQSNAVGFAISIIFNLLGGSWGEISDVTIKSISKFTPAYWAVNGINKLMSNNSFHSVINNILIMLLFSVVFFMIGTLKKSE